MANINTNNVATFNKQLLAAQNVAKTFCDSGLGRFGDVLTDDEAYYVFGRDLFKQQPNGRFAKVDDDESLLAHCLSFEMAGTDITNKAEQASKKMAESNTKRAAFESLMARMEAKAEGRSMMEAERQSSDLAQKALVRACEAEDDVKQLAGFALMAKVNGRVVRFSMRLASKLRREQELASKGIDGFNDLMTSLKADGDALEALDAFGVAREETPEVSLEKWLTVRNLLALHGYKPLPLRDTFDSMLTSEQGKQKADDKTLKAIVNVSGISEETVKDLLSKSTARNLTRTAETIQAAIQIVIRHLPKADISSGSSPYDVDAPQDFAELYQDALDSAKKSALRIARDPISALAQLAALRAEEDWT